MSDNSVDDGINSLIQLFTCARKYNIQYRLGKCRFLVPQCQLLGFVVGDFGRKVDPEKTAQLQAWPPYEKCADIVSHVAFCQYLREFYGPEFPIRTKCLRKYSKKGADFAQYAEDVEAQGARDWLTTKTINEVVLSSPDWAAAAAPWDSGRPFEPFYDASDEQWCAWLTQRGEPDGCPRPIGLIARTFDDVATRWSAFEREFFALREGTNAIRKWTQGFRLFARFDHLSLIHI